MPNGYNPPNGMWLGLFGNVGKQGDNFVHPISKTGDYYGFLSKADFNEDTQRWAVMFEMQPVEWLLNVFQFGSVVVNIPVPVGPASIYSPMEVETIPLLQVLGIKNTDQLAEGSWYRMHLEKTDQGAVNGRFYNPEIDTHPDNLDMIYGNYALTGASLELLPSAQLYTPNRQMTLEIVDETPKYLKVRRTIQKRYFPYGKKRRYRRPLRVVDVRLVAAPPVTAIGVMDIGQGNCNLLIDSNVEPITYFDAGYPLWFYVSSLPDNMRFGNPAYLGPITQNTANDLEVVLSHWDWDHWRLGHVAGLNNLPWLVPNQAFGGAANVFYNSLTNRTVYGGAPFNGGGGAYTIYRCQPPLFSPPAMVMNNTGMAMLVPIRLPTNAVAQHTVLMTGDANFNSVNGGPFLNLSGVEAVHHGSNTHGASQNLPAQVAAYNGAGRIFYSYGISAGLNYAYGFPVPQSVLNYRAAGWGVGGNNQYSTAEGNQIRALPTTRANRGNLRVGNQAALPNVPRYNATAFYNFPNALN
jgi:hypothetical protein